VVKGDVSLTAIVNKINVEDDWEIIRWRFFDIASLTSKNKSRELKKRFTRSPVRLDYVDRLLGFQDSSGYVSVGRWPMS
jgi:hypothetical protein